MANLHDKLEEEIRRSRAAREILDSDLIKESFATLESELVKKWIEAPEADRDGRERIWRHVWALRNFRGFFSIVLQTGELAQNHLDAIRVNEKHERGEFTESELRGPPNTPGAPL